MTIDKLQFLVQQVLIGQLNELKKMREELIADNNEFQLSAYHSQDKKNKYEINFLESKKAFDIAIEKMAELVGELK